MNLKEKLNEKFTKAKLLGTAALVPAAAALPMIVHAEGESASIQSVMTSTATSITTDMINMLTSIVPIAATVFSAVIVVSFGFRIISKFTGRH